MMRLLTRSAACVAATAGVLGVVPMSTASADAVYPTSRYPLSATGGAPLSSGFVMNIHANGPTVYAQERFHLIGGLRSAALPVTLMAYSDTACTDFLIAIPETTLTTDAHGNGHAAKTFTPQDVAAFRDPAGGVATYGLTWVIGVPGSPVSYTTGCQIVSLD